VCGTFLVACGDAAELLEPVDQSFDAVTLAVRVPIEWPTTRLIAAPWDREPDATAAQIASIPTAAVALVAHQPARPDARSPTTDALNCTLLAQLLGHRQVVLLSGRQDEGDGLAETVGAQMQFGGESTAAAA
jgi:hypothetical protein